MKEPMKLDSTRSTAVTDEYFWLDIDENTPVGVKMLLSNRDAGVATMGQLSSRDFFTHWAPFPKYRD